MKTRATQTQREIDFAIAAIIASTKRKNRKLNPLKVAEKIQTAVDGLGSISKVAERADISSEMLRQIYSVLKCSTEVKKLIKEGKIESYDILHRISKLPKDEQFKVAKSTISDGLNSEDVRAIITFRKEYPELTINEVVEHIKSSRNIKHYVAYFKIQPEKSNLNNIKKKFNEIVKKENIISFSVKDRIGKLILNSKGKNKLQEEAKRKRLTKRELLYEITMG